MKRKMSAGGRRKRVFLVDQFPAGPVALSEWVNQTPDLTLCGETDSATRTLTVVGHLRPDVQVNDLVAF